LFVYAPGTQRRSQFDIFCKDKCPFVEHLSGVVRLLPFFFPSAFSTSALLWALPRDSCPPGRVEASLFFVATSPCANHDPIVFVGGSCHAFRTAPAPDRENGLSFDLSTESLHRFTFLYPSLLMFFSLRIVVPASPCGPDDPRFFQVEPVLFFFFDFSPPLPHLPRFSVKSVEAFLFFCGFNTPV